jgi:ATP-dependent helicase/nuclease subunit A
MTSLDQPTLPFGEPQLPFEEPMTPLPSARTARPAPADQAARDGVRTRLDATLFVEAGAGTGKTTALVARIVELVRSGAEVHRIAAITFTEAAASELRDRVRHALERAVSDGTVRPEAVVELDNAAISTLHGFAQRLISEHPIEAGLPPEIEVLDEIQSSIEFENRWAAFVDELFERPALADVLLRSFATNLNLTSLRAVALAFQDQRDRLHPSGPPPETPVRPVDASPVIDTIRQAVEWSRHCTVDDDKLLGHLQGLAVLHRSLEMATSDLEVLHLLATSGRFASGGLGRAQAWTDGCKIDVVAATEAAEQARNELLTAVRGEVLERLLEEVRQFTLRSARDRMRAGRLVFHDLLVAARDLLRAAPQVRASLHDRYRHLLIDEFQDTDPLQVELAVLLATGGEVPSTSSLDGWDDVGLDPGRLFFVGDAKQSIYRFRRADVGLFLHVRDALADETLQLTTNFRSVPDITAWVNHAFADLIGEGVTGSQPRYDELKAARDDTVGPRRVVVLGRTHDTPIATIREVEAAEIAGAVRAAVDDGWPVRDRSLPDAPDAERPARWADVAILLPTRTSLPQLEAAFETAGVPYRVISSSLVWSTQEVRDLLNILQAIDDPTDEVALVAALRSPAFACSDDDLLSFRNAHGRWDVRSGPPDTIDPDHPVVTALQVVGRLRQQRWWLGVSGIADQIVRDLKLFELAFAHDRPRDRWRRLRFVLDQARTFERTPGATLRQFLTWAERQASDVARVREPSLPESDDDAVQILTVHGAKGLEFPITVVTGLNRRPDPRVATVV